MYPEQTPLGLAGQPSVRVFVSSTFRDMQREREELIKRVFPQLRRMCEEKGITWGEIDLRWGITEEEATQRKVLPICLAEACNSSIVIGILGERYGWALEAADLEGEWSAAYPGLAKRIGTSVTELEIIYGVLERPPTTPVYAFFYFRDLAYTNQLLVSELQADYINENSEAKTRLTDLKERLRRSGWPVYERYRDAAELGKAVLGDLTGLVRRLYPTKDLTDPLAREATAHRRFSASRYQVYVGRQALFDCLDYHAGGTSPPLVVSGEPGSGKTALLCNWSRHWSGEPMVGARLLFSLWNRWFRWLRRRPQRPPGEFFFLHLVGASGRSTSWPALLHRLLSELKQHFGFPEKIPDSPTGLSVALPAWLSRAATRQRLVIVLDGLDNLQEGDQADLSWLPTELPTHVRLIVSAGLGKVFDQLRQRDWTTLMVPPLSSIERKHLVVDYLAQFGKKLDTVALQALAAAPAAARPLYLRTLAAELRIFGVHEQLRKELATYLRAPAVEPLFEQVLTRLEQDYQHQRPGLVRDSFACLTTARHGLSERELLDLLGEPGSPLPAAYWSPFFLAVYELLIEHASVLRFFHHEFQAAVNRRYVPSAADQQACHRRLADYFCHREWSLRKIEEWPWQLVRLQAWDELRDILADLTFLDRAWPTHAAEVKSYWALLEANSPWRLADVYRFVLLDPLAYGQASWFVAVLLSDTGHWPEALRLSVALEEDARQRQDSITLRQVLGLRAVCLQAAGNGDEALKVLQAQEPLCREAEAHTELAVNLSNQGVLRRARGETAQALALHRQAEAVCRELDDPVGLAAALGNQAVIWLECGDQERARSLLREQERVCRISGDLDGLQKALGNQGVLYAEGEDWGRALRLHQEEERLCRRLADPTALRDCFDNQARVLRRLGDYDSALEKLDEMERLCRERYDMAGVAAALKQKAFMYGQDLHVPSEAVRLAREALHLAMIHHLQQVRQEVESLLEYLLATPGTG